MECLSCGTKEITGKRKFCTDECQITLKKRLDQQKGLLVALNTQYAVFSFTNRHIVLDILPKGFTDIYSFIYPRSTTGKPSDDYGKLTQLLGTAWWNEKKKSNKKHLASMHVFEQASLNNKEIHEVKPVEVLLPSVKNKYLKCLKLRSDDLNRSQVKETIKSAFRIQAKKHHPDLGGNSDDFRKIHKAYGELAAWSEKPSYVKRKGLPDKWFYDGLISRWFQPTVAG